MKTAQSVYNLHLPPREVGETIPSNTPHAVSVTLPTWDANVDYEEGKEWVHSKLRSGYPRYALAQKNMLLMQIYDT